MRLHFALRSGDASACGAIALSQTPAERCGAAAVASLMMAPGPARSTTACVSPPSASMLHDLGLLSHTAPYSGTASGQEPIQANMMGSGLREATCRTTHFVLASMMSGKRDHNYGTWANQQAPQTLRMAWEGDCALVRAAGLTLHSTITARAGPRACMRGRRRVGWCRRPRLLCLVPCRCVSE